MSRAVRAAIAIDCRGVTILPTPSLRSPDPWFRQLSGGASGGVTGHPAWPGQRGHRSGAAVAPRSPAHARHRPRCGSPGAAIHQLAARPRGHARDPLGIVSPSRQLLSALQPEFDGPSSACSRSKGTLSLGRRERGRPDRPVPLATAWTRNLRRHCTRDNRSNEPDRVEIRRVPDTPRAGISAGPGVALEPFRLHRAGDRRELGGGAFHACRCRHRDAGERPVHRRRCGREPRRGQAGRAGEVR